MGDNAPCCLYCGYNLTGLAEGTRCPECGLASVPEALRREVWDTVEVPRRLWTLMVRPLAKHPPGWWWALDRPGDLRRSFGVLGRNLAVSLVIVFAAFVAADSVVVEETWTSEYYDQADPRVATIWWYKWVLPFRLVRGEGDLQELSCGPAPWLSGKRWARSPATREVFSFRVFWEGRWAALAPAGVVYAWVVAVWAYVALVGLWSQLRRGLPDFARPQCSIIAAANYQSCKLVFLAGLVALACGLQLAVRWTCHSRWLSGNAVTPSLLVEGLLSSLLVHEWAVKGIAGGLLLAAGMTWVGALRSDFTHQLVRSRWHALRILLMYAVVLPAVTFVALLFTWHP